MEENNNNTNNDDQLYSRIDRVLNQLEQEEQEQPAPQPIINQQAPQQIIREPIYINQSPPQAVDYDNFRKDTKRYEKLYEDITRNHKRKKQIEERKLQEMEVKTSSSNYGLYSLSIILFSIIGYGLKVGIDTVKDLQKNKVNF